MDATTKVSQAGRRDTLASTGATLLTHDGEKAVIDSDHLRQMVAELGPIEAETKVSAALDQLAQGLAELTLLYTDGRIDALQHRAQRLVPVAESIGLCCFSRVSGDVAGCAACGDWPALGATLSRLDRVADGSIIALWDLQDLRL